MIQPGHTYTFSPPPPDIQAAISTFKPTNRRRSLMTRLADGKTAEQMIRDYDELGPGVVGYYLDLKAAMVSLIRWQVQKWDPDSYCWVSANEPIPNTSWATQFRGPRNESSTELIYRLARDVEAIGQVGIAKVVTVEGDRYEVLPLDSGGIEILKDGDPKILGFKRSKGAEKPKTVDAAYDSDDWTVVEENNLLRIFRRHPRWPNEPYSPLIRSLKEIRRYDNATRALHRPIASQLALAKVLFFKGHPKQFGSKRNGKFEFGFLGQQIDQMMEYGERAITDYEEDQVSSAMPYPLVAEEEPKLIEVAKLVDPDLLDLKEDAVKDLARSWNIPHAIIMEGQGSATRMLNEVLQDEAFRATSIMPLAQLIADTVTAVFLRPWLHEANQTWDSVSLDPVQYRIWPVADDDTTPEPEEVFGLLDRGVITPEYAAQILNVEEGILSRPADVTAWDWWCQYQGAKSEQEENPPEDITANLSTDWTTRRYGQ
jgi:hypothetical protein